MDPTDPLASGSLSPVDVDTDAALDRTRARGRRRQRRRTAALVAGAVGVVVLVAAVSVAAIGDDGDAAEDVLADGPAEQQTPEEVAPPEGDRAMWTVDPDAPPEPDATTFVALVTRVGCHGGVTGDVRPPSVEVRPDDIVVTFAVAPAAPGAHTCPGNDQVRYEVDVGEPIGDRYLRDGGCPLDPRGGVDCLRDDEGENQGEGIPNDVRWPSGAHLEARACDAPEGSPLDVAHEPDWRQHADYATVTDEDWCLVRIDVVAERAGPEHCGFGAARVLIVGDPFGTPYTTAADSVEYVRDPDGVFGDPELTAGFAAEVDLPPGAEPTGYRIDGRSLWIDPDDPSAVWVFAPDTTIERWPRGESPVCR